ncbi:MAG: putative holin [Algiphilus sp.]|uniref:putative holin n=1 Tax=Algiphilus sp. TaxID=1872431 RepID=UPI0032F02176
MRAPRLWQLFLSSVVLLLIVAVIAPHQLGLLVWKLALVCTAGAAGYWFDRWFFPYARPHQLLGPPRRRDAPSDYGRAGDIVVAAAMLRRALIVAAAMIAVSAGL